MQIVFVLIGDKSPICVAHPSIASPLQTALDIVVRLIILFLQWKYIVFSLYAEGKKLLVSRTPKLRIGVSGNGVLSKNTESCY